ncbi:MAG: peptide chain release factor family protein [bacterium]
MFEFLNRSGEQLLSEAEVEYFRSSGPGGQKRDSTESAVRIRHPEVDLTTTCERTRSREKNRKIALRDLKIKYALQVRHDLPPGQFKIPPFLEQYVENGLRVKTTNPYYPFLLKLVLDLLSATEGRVSEVAKLLTVTTSRVVDFLKRDSRALTRANQIRKKYEHGPLK